MKKLLGIFLSICIMGISLVGCGADNDSISVLTREEGSGTRGAFIELFGIEQKDENGEKADKTITSAESTNSTSVMITTVEGNRAAIGYLSLGSLDESKVKALTVDGEQPSRENIKNGSYKIARPFNVATKGDPSPLVNDFLSFILSEDGQNIVEDAGYISEGNNGKYESQEQSGKITIGGSSSVTPVMEKLKEAYIELNPDVTIDLQQNDSTSGMTGTIDGIYDIGMASREIKDSEQEKGLVGTKIAMDGIAVIVNKENTLDNITSEQVFNIYTGETTLWSEIK